ncbi:imelysin family protein [Acidimangrovimonas pyrenivorans]|uniref:Imelysin family protein n=1 Tax=Acidimangrovimonas pyrenivorans TaxID=2030798 RepID=A0ABV7AKQ0_9RHOB
MRISRLLAPALTACALLLPGTASAADPVVDRVLDTLVLPKIAAFKTVTAGLAAAAKADCRPDNAELRKAWNGAMDAWLQVQDFRFGPLEDGGRRQAIAYWPDRNGHRRRALKRILTGADPILKAPDRYQAESVAARGLYAVEAMLYDPAFSKYGAGDPGCTLVRAASADLANVAADVDRQWRESFAQIMRTAGADDNERFLDPSEARQAIFTALLTSMQFDIDERLGEPLGTFDRPRPTRAESRHSGRSLRNLQLSLAAHEALAKALVPGPDKDTLTREDFERVRWMAGKLDEPVFAGVTDPERRFRIEALQTALTMLREEVNQELSAALGVTMGLNAFDGD